MANDILQFNGNQIANFVIEKMNSYIAGGMEPETAARLTRGELAAIYKGEHRSRNKSGIWIMTPPPEAMSIEAALVKCDVVLANIISRKDPASTTATTNKPRNEYKSSSGIKHAVAAGIGIKDFYERSRDNAPDAYTTDLRKIEALWNKGIRLFKAFINGRFLALDIDRKPSKVDGVETFYRMFPKKNLPAELQNIPDSFPCYTLTPSGGFHLYFKYTGPELKLKELAPSIEIKEWQITCPGSREENGDYVLYGELNEAPPLYGLIIDAIEEMQRKKEQARAKYSQSRASAVEDRSTCFEKTRISLDVLADEATSAYEGNHNRQVSFAYRACRCRYSDTEALTYVKSRPDIFGEDKDTETTIRSVFSANGGKQ